MAKKSNKDSAGEAPEILDVPSKVETKEEAEPEQGASQEKKAAVGTVVLRDLRGRKHVINLPHEVYCAESNICQCKMSMRAILDRTKDGKHSFRMEEVRQPRSITILPRGKSEPLHPAVLKCEQVRNLMRARPTVLRVVR